MVPLNSGICAPRAWKYISVSFFGKIYLHGLYVIEEMNNPNSDTTSKRAYQLQNIEKAFKAGKRVQGKTSSPSADASNAIITVADLFEAVKRLDAKEKTVSGIVKQKRRYNTNTGSSSKGGAQKDGAVPSGDIIEYSLVESQAQNPIKEAFDKAQRKGRISGT